LRLSIPTDEEYKAALTDLNDLIKGAFQLSVWLTELRGDTRKRIASILFAKINLCALSIIKLLPHDSKAHVAKEMDRERFCDKETLWWNVIVSEIRCRSTNVTVRTTGWLYRS
jgi:hypothetical protein